jgi:hypothetical protein
MKALLVNLKGFFVGLGSGRDIREKYDRQGSNVLDMV